MSATTVLVPTFNGAAHLPALMDSIAAQATKPGRVLFVDDGSTDATVAVIESRLRAGWELVRNPVNTGLYGTIAQSLGEVHTPLVCLAFQDDVLGPDHLGELERLAELHPMAGFFWPGHDTILADGTMKVRGEDTGRVVVVRPGVETWRSTLRRGCYWTISGSLSRTDALRRHRFRTDLPHCGDFELLLRAVRSETLVYFERPLMQIRQHQGQASTRNLSVSRDIRERLLVWQEQLTLHPGDSSVALRAALLRQAIRLIAGRSLGHVRRGRVGAGVRTLALAGSALGGMLIGSAGPGAGCS